MKCPTQRQPLFSVRSAPHARRGRPGAPTVAAGLFALFLILYNLNGDFLVGNDAASNVYLPVSILEEGNLSFDPEEFPSMFSWRLETDDGAQTTVRIPSWNAAAIGRLTWGDLRDRGHLEVEDSDYYLVASRDPERRGYANTYGPGAGLMALPFFAVQSLFVEDLASNRKAVWYGGKFVAAFCVAVSVALVFLTASRLVATTFALAIAIAYGVGTCVWSGSSQTLWQSGPNVVFVSLAAYSLLRADAEGRDRLWAAVCGAAATCAVVCRPTSALVVVAIGVYLVCVAVRRWRESPSTLSALSTARPLVAYIAAGLPVAIALGAYNWYYLGSPWNFGQYEAGRRTAAFYTGSADVWQTPFFEGFFGHLISPSRGMLVYSPILAFAFWGLFRAWREPTLRPLRPLGVAVLVLLVLQSKWFGWHGGWSFGHRLMVDAAPLLALFGVAVASRIAASRPLLYAFVSALIWSVGVQVIGAYAYNVMGWNNRIAYEVPVPGRDKPVRLLDRDAAEGLARAQSAAVREVQLGTDAEALRRRLWSLTDSQLVYYATHFAEARRAKKRYIDGVLKH